MLKLMQNSGKKIKRIEDGLEISTNKEPFFGFNLITKTGSTKIIAISPTSFYSKKGEIHDLGTSHPLAHIMPSIEAEDFTKLDTEGKYDVLGKGLTLAEFIDTL